MEPTVTCEMHGPMKFIFALDKWTCLGFDGEGCPMEATSEHLWSSDSYRRGARNLTITPTGRFKWR